MTESCGQVVVVPGVEGYGKEGVVRAAGDLRGPPAYFHPGAKIMTLLHTLLAGADCIDDADMLRSAATAAVLSTCCQSTPPG